MAYEKPGYRRQLEALRERFPDGKPLNLKQAAEYVGVSGPTLKNAKNSPVRQIAKRMYIVPLEALADFLA